MFYQDGEHPTIDNNEMNRISVYGRFVVKYRYYSINIADYYLNYAINERNIKKRWIITRFLL